MGSLGKSLSLVGSTSKPKATMKQHICLALSLFAWVRLRWLHLKPRRPLLTKTMVASVIGTHGWIHMERFRVTARALTQPVVGGVMSNLAIHAVTSNTPRTEEIVGRLRQWSYEACATPAPGY